ncbi:hypothetical protein BAUCODRAFT_524099 [Baudoinia panamericana UAMH 10762]|uniref:Uncharacterized protein n=1 Tax=Baudoinia panamericana (strain UAMH 10762) TaxID=717646 RepID=M2MEP9_BAUPA|nr:uncharacterized protein BAUCODRAFT_524099 [Baudoinia panamericana UAMH 10762]EMC95046.1 hypothetical protein BAUCODRAFT_524099 [Baudoinia panamericana UAMH 10762]
MLSQVLAAIQRLYSDSFVVECRQRSCAKADNACTPGAVSSMERVLAKGWPMETRFLRTVKAKREERAAKSKEEADFFDDIGQSEELLRFLHSSEITTGTM